LWAGPHQVKAELIVGLTVNNQLATFDSATPGTATVPVIITGIGNDTIIGIDFRPATGQLYGLGTLSGAPGSARLYTINPTTGVATLASTLNPFAGLGSLAVGFDFNPVPDRLRLVTTTDHNFRIDVVTGTPVIDGTLAFAAGDPNATQNPNIVGSAYANNFAGTLTTTLYGIDSNLDILVTQNPPNAGTLNTVGPLGFNTNDFVGFDISGITGIAYTSLTGPTAPNSQFFTINLATGAATLVGTIGGPGSAALTLRDIAAPIGAAVVIPAPSGLVLASIGSLGLLGYGWRRRKQV
jgi:hypothetical protein